MILFDTNVLIDARNQSVASHDWAMEQVEAAIAGEGGGINAVTLAELCAGSPQPADIAPEIIRLGLVIVDLPVTASEICGRAYRRYVQARRASGGGAAPKIPLPDFSSARTQKSWVGNWPPVTPNGLPNISPRWF